MKKQPRKPKAKTVPICPKIDLEDLEFMSVLKLLFILVFGTVTGIILSDIRDELRDANESLNTIEYTSRSIDQSAGEIKHDVMMIKLNTWEQLSNSRKKKSK